MSQPSSKGLESGAAGGRWSWLLLAALVAAPWPVWRWYVARWSDGSDEPFGVIALLVLVALAFRNRLPFPSEKHFALPAAGLVLYATTFHFLPPLARAIIVVGSLCALFLRGPGVAGLWALAALSLPVVATLQFYLGYPLRLLAAAASVFTLQCCGWPVVREGALLYWGGETVMVDTPCSGVHMLYGGLFLGFLLAAVYRLNIPRTMVVGALALVLVIVANMLRASLLFFKEAHIVSLPAWTHAGIGALLFAAAAGLTAFLVKKLQPCAQ